MQNENIKVINHFISNDKEEMIKRITYIMEKIMNNEANKIVKAN